MEISELDPKIKDTQEELIRHQEKTRKFKEYVQGLFIDLYTQDEFNRSCLLYTSDAADE